MTIYTGLGGPDCGFDFIVGDFYLVYAYGKTKLETNRCTRTKRNSTESEKEVEELKKLQDQISNSNSYTIV